LTGQKLIDPEVSTKLKVENDLNTTSLNKAAHDIVNKIGIALGQPVTSQQIRAAQQYFQEQFAVGVVMSLQGLIKVPKPEGVIRCCNPPGSPKLPQKSKPHLVTDSGGVKILKKCPFPY